MKYALLVLLLAPSVSLASNWDQVPALEAQKFARKEKEMLKTMTADERYEYLKFKAQYLQSERGVSAQREIAEAIRRRPVETNTTIIQENYR